MDTFAQPESLATLAAAREAYTKLLATLNEHSQRETALKADLQAAQEMLDENANRTAAMADDIKSAQEKLFQADKDLKASHERGQQSANDLQTARQTIQSLEAQVETLQKQIKSSEVKAAEICASVGVDPLRISPDAKNGETQEDLMTQFRAITDPAQRTAFYRKHKNELLSRK